MNSSYAALARISMFAAAIAPAAVSALGACSSPEAPGGPVSSDSLQSPDHKHRDAGNDSGPAPSGDGGACTGCARDWAQFPPIAQVDGASELWVMSDVHGDYQAFTTLLTAGGLLAGAPDVAANAQWKGGRAVLVIVGDLIDKGPDAPDVVRLAAALQASAQKAGGRVIVTMGNHEAEFLADPENSKATKSDGFDPELTADGLSPDQTAAGGNDIGYFIRNLPFAARVNDWFFAHAGKTDGKTISALSSDLQSGVDSAGFGAPVLSGTDSMLEARLSGTGSQWWDATGDARGLLSQWTSALGANHLVMGHQPGDVAFADGTTRAQDTLFKAYGGLLYLVDTGSSVDVDQTGGMLLHVPDLTTPDVEYQVSPDGSSSQL